MRIELVAEPITSREYSSSIRAIDDMIESARYEREQERKSSNYKTLKEEYTHKARILDEDAEMKDKGDPGIGAYGIYLDDWDALLNEVWGILADTMQVDEFEQLLEEQRAWIQEKDAD